MTTPSPAQQLNSWLAEDQVRAQAHRLGISGAMISRLRAQGILARPARQRSPARALRQLEAVATARTVTKDPVRITHAVWWSGAPLEDWTVWRAVQVQILDWLARFDDWFATLSDDERDAEARRFADQIDDDPHLSFPRQRIRGRADRKSVAALLLGLRVSDPNVIFPLDPDPTEWPTDETGLLELFRRNLATPVDDGRADTVGDLLGVALHVEHLPEPGLLATVTLAGWMPDVREAPALMEALTEERAADIRDLLRAAAGGRSDFDLTYRVELAGLLVLTFDRMAHRIPQLLDKSYWPSPVNAAQQ